ncbi:MAG: VCBS repeat-containing protein, partial [Bdellovibrionales bacterium]|nr:VCBS repeat-containing protein [Bdellovibrionales bacterium]
MKKLYLLLLLSLLGPDVSHGADCDGNLVDDETEILSGDAADCDRDGKPDLCALLPSGFGYAVEGEELGSVFVNSQVGSGKFAELNGDGRPDAVLLAGFRMEDSSAIGEYRLSVLLSDGPGSLADPVQLTAGTRSAFSLREGELGTNIYLPAAGSDPALLFVNDGTGEFTEVMNPPASAINILLRADFSGDGVDDLIRKEASGMAGLNVLKIEYGNGDGTFAPGVELLDEVPESSKVQALDVNRDGTADLVVFTQADGSLRTDWFLGDVGGELAFAKSLSFAGVSAEFAAFGDVDGEGGPDLVLDGDATFVVPNVSLGSGTPEAETLELPNCSGRRFADLDG